MKKLTPKAWGRIVIYLFVLALNILPIFLFRESAGWHDLSWLACLLMVAMIVYVGLLYLLRNRGNMLFSGFTRMFSTALLQMTTPEKGRTEAQKKIFSKMFFVWCAAIPFCLPPIFLARSDFFQTLIWLVGIVMAPGVIILAMRMLDFSKLIKAEKQKQEQMEEERRRQEQREEMGKWR